MKMFKDLNPAELEQFTQLYSTSFLPVETKPIEKIVSMLKQDQDYHLYAAENGEIIGFSLLYIFKDLQSGLLDYMAVIPPERGKGVGKRLFQHTLASFQKTVKEPTGLLLEVQDEKYAHDDKDRSTRINRLLFYSKLGAKIIAEDYLLPPQSDSEPEKTYLLIVPFKEIRYIPKEILLRYIEAIHQRAYGYRSGDLLRKIAGKLPDKCELLDIPRYELF